MLLGFKVNEGKINVYNFLIPIKFLTKEFKWSAKLFNFRKMKWNYFWSKTIIRSEPKLEVSEQNDEINQILHSFFNWNKQDK